MAWNLLNSQQKTIVSAAAILAISTLISRFLGVIRDGLIFSKFGASIQLDIYFAAFRIPDLVYNILILGGVVIAFLPLFSEYFSQDQKNAWEFTSNCLNIFLFLLILISLLFFLFAPFLMRIIVPGFSEEKLNPTVFLTRILFLSSILLGLSSIFSGILQYFNRFLVYSLCPILYNLGIILGILVISPYFGILGVVFGVIFGAILHLLIQIPSALNCGFRYQPIFNFKDPKLKRVFLLMLPRTFAISFQEINWTVITAIASTLATGSIAIFNFANNIQYFPIGIVGLSLAVAAFPALSKDWVENKEKFLESFSLVFRQTLYLIIPISILIFVFRNQVVEIILKIGQVVLKYGQFSPQAAKLTAACLGLFSLGIFAQSLIPLISRAFFAFQDTKTPTLVAIISVALNIILSLFLTWVLKFQNSFQIFLKKGLLPGGIEDISILGLPLALSIAAIFQFFLLIFFLRRKLKILESPVVEK